MRRRGVLVALGAGAGFTRPGWALTPAVMRISTLLEEDPATWIASRILHEAYARLNLQLEVVKMPGER